MSRRGPHRSSTCTHITLANSSTTSIVRIATVVSRRPAWQIEKATPRRLGILEATAGSDGAQDGLATNEVALEHVCLKCCEGLLEGVDGLADGGVHLAVESAVFSLSVLTQDTYAVGRRNSLPSQ
jgi:hypothetical protein